MNINIALLREKVNAYKQVLANTRNYRQEWKDKTRQFIKNMLQDIIQQTELKASVVEKNNIENLEAVILDLGRSSSGIAENLENADVKRIMVKNNGSLIYQQLFNGKIMVMLVSPHIEGYGEPKSPKSLQIIRPDEVAEQAIFRHVKDLLDDITGWEDYDDEDPKTKVPFQPIGFRHTVGLTDNNGDDAADVTKQ
ncbi:hypothetical protein [Terrimonas pollutisoli]|uniref:hypothetical protein n=1 Tax=Terrimonas pollutisoli TaxID=3034147 RepID=UPI0023EB5E4C|nr:hypothetical protein [Terrimonas sp. H1YJ31]